MEHGDTTAWKTYHVVCAISTNGLIQVIYVKDIIKRQQYRNSKIRAQQSFREEEYGHKTVIFDILHHTSSSSVLTNWLPQCFKCGWSQPSCSPGKNVCGYFFWGYLKDCTPFSTPICIMRRSCKWKWSYHWRDQQLHVAWHGWQLCGSLTPSQLSFRIPSWTCAHKKATYRLNQYKSQLLFKYEMPLLYARKLWIYYILKPFYVFPNSLSNIKVSEI